MREVRSDTNGGLTDQENWERSPEEEASFRLTLKKVDFISIVEQEGDRHYQQREERIGMFEKGCIDCHGKE